MQIIIMLLLLLNDHNDCDNRSRLTGKNNLVIVGNFFSCCYRNPVKDIPYVKTLVALYQQVQSRCLYNEIYITSTPISK